MSPREPSPSVQTVGMTAVSVQAHKTCVGSFGGALQAPRKRADLLASGNPHAVLTLPELPNVITGLFVVNSSLIETYMRRCSMNVGSLLVTPSPRWPAEDPLACAPSAPPLNTPTHTHTGSDTDAHLITLPPSEPCDRRTTRGRDRSVSMSWCPAGTENSSQRLQHKKARLRP